VLWRRNHRGISGMSTISRERRTAP
jgi:hypothetical protein